MNAAMHTAGHGTLVLDMAYSQDSKLCVRRCRLNFAKRSDQLNWGKGAPVMQTCTEQFTDAILNCFNAMDTKTEHVTLRDFSFQIGRSNLQGACVVTTRKPDHSVEVKITFLVNNVHWEDLFT